MRTPTTTRTAAALTAVAVLVQGCGAGELDVQDVPLVVAEPVAAPSPTATARDTWGRDEPASATAPVGTGSSEPDATVAGPAEPATATTTSGPDTAAAAAFIASEEVPGATGLDHVVVDLDGDGDDEVVTTGILGTVALVRIAWWEGGRYRSLVDDLGGAGEVVESVRATDLDGDGTTELLVTATGGGAGSISLWSVLGRGRVERVEAAGGCHDGSHVYGVVGARLVATDSGVPAIVASCDDSPLPMADWSEQRWEWQDGTYRVVTPPGGDEGRVRATRGEAEPEDGSSQQDAARAEKAERKAEKAREKEEKRAEKERDDEDDEDDDEADEDGDD